MTALNGLLLTRFVQANISIPKKEREKKLKWLFKKHKKQN